MSDPSSASGPSSSSGPSSPAGTVRFSERLYVPWWWGLAALVVTGVVGYEISLSAHRSAWGYLGYVGTAVLCALVLWSMSRTQVTVTADGELHAAKARLPRAVIGRAATIPATAKSAALGRQLDPAAFLVHRAWIKTMVLLVLDDPDDPTPYWLVSTRRPAELLKALGVPDAAEAVTAPDEGTASDEDRRSGSD
ncbi:DUF3093 domain-containing protein [Gordonia sp. NB41Y]|uniref:DUF3093 domain-containing protein n=1 Tax=Gordonia sp. NB41Y TaxID=875808 RepID=UPI0006B1DCCA|nr:DUF3093 domain-containing protein [Gordonia sp. NB41Y]EMP11196.2 hypothetical protein ISGA_3806 [Gordonia sp. NB41Y]WLP91073.1 DUF3093 domain-containing protein [Gordonia sp. NB41Y]